MNGEWWFLYGVPVIDERYGYNTGTITDVTNDVLTVYFLHPTLSDTCRRGRRQRIDPLTVIYQIDRIRYQIDKGIVKILSSNSRV